ncbi:KOW motif-containing protein [Aulosira sp. FACHB-615]|nr:KOW motif-containing protein [Aulosira sp. FACHB-615]
MTTAAPNLGKVFNGTARPATDEDIAVLTPGDWIKRREHPWCYQFKKRDGDRVICTWEGDEFFIPRHLLMVVEVLENQVCEKFFRKPEPSSTPAPLHPYTPHVGDERDNFASFKTGDRVRITQGKHKGKSAEIHEIKAENHICCWVEEGFYLHFASQELELDSNFDGKLHPYAPHRVPEPWDSPKKWESQGIECFYDGRCVSWGNTKIQVTDHLKKTYINPLTLVNFLEDSWNLLPQITRVLTQPMAKLAISFACDLTLRQVSKALELGVDIGLIQMQGKLYSLSSQRLSRVTVKPGTHITNEENNLGIIKDDLGFGFIVDWLEGDSRTYNWERDDKAIEGMSLAPQWLVDKFSKDACWNSDHFGEVPHQVEPDGQATIFYDTTGEPPEPEDFGTIEEYEEAWQKWEAKHSTDLPPDSSTAFKKGQRIIYEGRTGVLGKKTTEFGKLGFYVKWDNGLPETRVTVDRLEVCCKTQQKQPSAEGFWRSKSGLHPIKVKEGDGGDDRLLRCDTLPIEEQISLCQQRINQQNWRIQDLESQPKQNQLIKDGIKSARNAIADEEIRIEQLKSLLPVQEEVPEKLRFAYRQLRQKGMSHSQALSLIS